MLREAWRREMRGEAMARRGMVRRGMVRRGRNFMVVLGYDPYGW